MSCAAFHERLDGFLAVTLAPADEREVREHLGQCDDCRREVESLEPSLVFARLGEESEPSAAEVDDFLAGIHRGIELRQAERGATTLRRRRRVIGSIAASLAFAALGGLWSLRTAPAPAPAPVLAAHAAAPAVAASESELPRIEDLDRPDARVYELASGDASGLKVVMIVDDGLDL